MEFYRTPNYLMSNKCDLDEVISISKHFIVSEQGGRRATAEVSPLKSRTKHNNRVRVPFYPCAHERQCEALGFRD